jgi:peptide/nickel transport system ATP-binding protein
MFDGEDIGAIPAKKFALLPMRKRIQMVFQDPTDSLNPRFTALRAIADPILRLGESGAATPCARAGGARAPGRAAARSASTAFPHQLSGGRRHASAFARASRSIPTCHPRRADAALDVSVQAARAQSAAGASRITLGMSYLFVSPRPQRGAAPVRRVIVMKRDASSSKGRPSRCWLRRRRNIPATSWRRFPPDIRVRCHPSSSKRASCGVADLP